MATVETFSNAIPAFIADHGSTSKKPGATMKWAAVDAATYDPDDTGSKKVPAGTIMVRFADGEMAPLGSTDAAASPDETPTVAVGILASDANENAPAESLSGYGVYVGGVVFENLLPDAGGGPPKVLSSGEKDALADGGCLFQYVTYKDSRAD